LFQVARRFDMEVQPSLVLLQKTLLNIEGLGRQLYPELDLWQTALPFLERWMRDRYSPVNVAKRMGDRLPELLEQLPRLPELVRENSAGNNRPSRNIAAEEISQLRKEAKENKQSTNKAILAVSCAIAALLLALPNNVELAFSPLSWSLLALSGIFLLRR
jgi:ubiquinone biosynthesis protein